jgi:hypothetical protein
MNSPIHSIVSSKELPWEIAAIFTQIAAWAKPYNWHVEVVSESFPPGDEMQCHLPELKRVYFMQLGRSTLSEVNSEWMEFEMINNLVCINNEVVVNLCEPDSLTELEGLIQFYD